MPHPIESIFGVVETVTDKEGNFSITQPRRTPLNPTVYLQEPHFTIFKPEYRSYSGGSLLIIVGKIPTGLYESNGRVVVELERLTTRQERIDSQGRLSISDCYASNSCPNLIRLINIERANLGLGPVGQSKSK